MSRQSRKLDHLSYSVTLPDGPGKNGFSDFTLVHNCLPNLDWREIDVSSSLAGITLKQPIIINAITGGAADVTKVNAELAEVARLTGSAMAVGSQFAALEDPSVRQSFSVVRQVNPDGVLFANLGAHVTPSQARQAVEMIGANAIQIHLNAAQEIFMAEGDRDFSGYLENIAKIAAESIVPVIVKEVGCGIAAEQASQLAKTGIKVIDVGGVGGTNFLAIESARRQVELAAETAAWGIPTAISTVEVAEALPAGIDLMVSGGIRTPLEVVKALALGGAAVGMAGPLVKLIQGQGVAETVAWIGGFLDDLKRFMLLTGVEKVTDLQKVPVIISGFSDNWLTARGIDTTKYAKRRL